MSEGTVSDYTVRPIVLDSSVLTPSPPPLSPSVPEAPSLILPSVRFQTKAVRLFSNREHKASQPQRPPFTPPVQPYSKGTGQDPWKRGAGFCFRGTAANFDAKFLPSKKARPRRSTSESTLGSLTSGGSLPLRLNLIWKGGREGGRDGEQRGGGNQVNTDRSVSTVAVVCQLQGQLSPY
ncbi:hypothetical protein EYF80_013221 [Liparis tanakae]|uniref:Uncharacterized protein n=1 Tax=Liparis tanakae TaxID=230148 RepID=A0A4Z2IFL6_9TELE|nr:hypothetical protein EYF80_013221 [Liparis tanakae]